MTHRASHRILAELRDARTEMGLPADPSHRERKPRARFNCPLCSGEFPAAVAGAATPVARRVSAGVRMTERNYEPLHEVTMYQARCTDCGTIEDDYGDFSAWADPDIPRNSVVENDGWFERFEGNQLVALLCPKCQKCEVCGADDAHDVNDDGHLICGDHEEHDFSAVTA